MMNYNTSLSTINGKHLMEEELKPIRYIIDDMISAGVHILAGSPKIGKSWMSLWLCLSVANGTDVWDFKAHKGGVLRGCTALLDAIGGAIRHIGNIHKYARHEDVPENTMFVITTDGMENASPRFDSKQVKQMRERQKEKFGWEFIFVAANIDAVETARNFGIDENRAVNYHADAKGTACLYDNVSDVVCSVRMGCDIEDGWSEKLQKDFKSRK